MNEICPKCGSKDTYDEDWKETVTEYQVTEEYTIVCDKGHRTQRRKQRLA